MNHTWKAGTGWAETNDPTINGTTWPERWYGDNSNNGNNPWDENDPDWATPGGDFDAVSEDVVTIEETVGWYVWNVTDLVRRWVNLSSPNYGMLLKGDISSYKTFRSAEEAAALRPKLVVTTYTNSMLDNIDELTLYDNDMKIIDYVAWGADPGTNDDEAVTVGQWTDGDYVPIPGSWQEGYTLGRDNQSTDTDTSDDWVNATSGGWADPYGVNRANASGHTRGGVNDETFTPIPEYEAMAVPVIIILMMFTVAAIKMRRKAVKSHIRDFDHHASGIKILEYKRPILIINIGNRKNIRTKNT